MKRLLLILFLASCHKEDSQPAIRGQEIPPEIYGTYHADITSNSGHWQQTLNVVNKNTTEVYLIFSGTMFGDTLSAFATAEISIPQQNFETSLNIPYSISGTGQFSDPQIHLSIGKSIQSDLISYDIIAVHQ